MFNPTVSQPHNAVKTAVPRANVALQDRQHKSALVDLGLACLARGETRMVIAITRILRERGLRDA